jgi:Fe-S-cluster-containing hydrogenase component 2
LGVVNPKKSSIRIERLSLTEDIPHVCTHGRECKLECIEACKFDAIKIKGSIVHIDPEKCKGCGLCKKACPLGAIQLCEKKAYKCDLCEQIGNPICVEFCSQEALKLIEV